MKSKSLEYSCFRICNVDVQKSLIESKIDWPLSIWTNLTPQQHAKANNVAQDDEQHNIALRRWNHEKTQKKKFDICENHLLRSKEREKKT